MNALPEIRAHSRTIEREKLTRSSVPTIVSNLISEACGGSLACFLGDMSLRSCLPTNKFPLALALEVGPCHPHPGNLLQKKIAGKNTKTGRSFEVLSIFPTKY